MRLQRRAQFKRSRLADKVPQSEQASVQLPLLPQSAFRRATLQPSLVWLSHRATALSSADGKFAAGLQVVIQASPNPFRTALMFRCLNSTYLSDRSFSAAHSARLSSALLYGRRAMSSARIAK